MSVIGLYLEGYDVDLGRHRKMLYQLADDVLADQIIELGVRTGVSTVALLAAAEVTDGYVWSCDAAPHSAPPEVVASDRWTFHLGDDLEAAEDAPPTCDLLFIDTSHTREHTEAELALYGPKVVPGGVIVLHDADPVEGQDVMGPALDYARERGLTLTYYPGDHGLAVIR